MVTEVVVGDKTSVCLTKQISTRRPWPLLSAIIITINCESLNSPEETKSFMFIPTYFPGFKNLFRIADETQRRVDIF